MKDYFCCYLLGAIFSLNATLETRNGPSFRRFRFISICWLVGGVIINILEAFK
jgi:hypothetical protein